MLTEDELEQLKRRVSCTPGASQEQRERWHIITQLAEIKKTLAAVPDIRSQDE